MAVVASPLREFVGKIRKKSRVTTHTAKIMVVQLRQNRKEHYFGDTPHSDWLAAQSGNNVAIIFLIAGFFKFLCRRFHITSVLSLSACNGGL